MSTPYDSERQIWNQRRSSSAATSKSSPKRHAGKCLFFVQDMLKGEVVAGAKVLVSNGSQVIFEGFTGTDGVLHMTEKRYFG